MGLGRTRLSIRSDSAFHLGKWPKTRIFRNFELRRIRKAFCPASPKIILGLGLGLTCRFQQPPANRHWCFSAPKTTGDRAPEPQRGVGGGGRRLCGGGPSAGVAGSPLGRPAAADRAAAAPAARNRHGLIGGRVSAAFGHKPAGAAAAAGRRQQGARQPARPGPWDPGRLRAARRARRRPARARPAGPNMRLRDLAAPQRPDSRVSWGASRRQGAAGPDPGRQNPRPAPAGRPDRRAGGPGGGAARAAANRHGSESVLMGGAGEAQLARS